MANNFVMINYKEDRTKFMQALSGSQDVLYIDFDIAGRASVMIFVDGISDKELTDRHIIEPLKRLNKLSEPWQDCLNQTTSITDPIMIPKDFDEAVNNVASGDMVLLIDGAECYFGFTMRKYLMRSISEPPTSTILKGPREGFIEDFKINMTLLRRKLRSPSLVFKLLKIGQYSQTNVAVAWLNGVADDSIVNSVMEKIKKIDIDGILDSSYVARYLENNKHSLFNQVGSVEKPDIVAARMLEGRIAIIVDGSPMVLTVPFIFLEHFQSSEDYYSKSFRASLTRIIRILALVIAIYLPALYVALQEFQFQIFPVKLLITIMNSIYNMPFTPVLEMIVLLLLFEVLSETSVRMPRYVSTALSIVGAIVLGETAVNAGILSVASVLISAISTTGLYSVPDEVNVSSLLRLGFVVVAGLVGLFGIIICTVILVAYIVGLESFGNGYTVPFSPMLINDFQDGLTIKNVTEMKKRPYSIPTNNRTRCKDDD